MTFEEKSTFISNLKIGEVIQISSEDKISFIEIDYHQWASQEPRIDPRDMRSNSYIVIDPPFTRNIILLETFNRHVVQIPSSNTTKVLVIGIFLDCETKKIFYENSRAIYAMTDFTLQK